MVSFYIMASPTGGEFEVLYKKEDDYASKSQANDLAEAIGYVIRKEGSGSRGMEEICKLSRGAATGDLHVLEHVNHASTNDMLYVEHTNWDKWFMYKLLEAKLLRVLRCCLTALWLSWE